MALANTKQHIITNGASVVVRASKDQDSPGENDILGLTTNASWQENFSLQDAIVIGHFGPVSIDPQSYSCSITLGVFIPVDGKMSAKTYATEVTKGILEELPDRETIFSAKGLVLTYKSLDFYNQASGKVLAKFYGVMLESEGGQVEGNTYARANVTLRALAKEKTAW